MELLRFSFSCHSSTERKCDSIDICRSNDNKLAENGGWDRKILAIELQGLSEIGFNIELTAIWESPE